MLEITSKYFLNIAICEDSESPRVWDNTGTLHLKTKKLAYHDESSYNVIDDPLCENYLLGNPDYVVLPIYILDHGGIRLDTVPFNDKWDSWKCGYIFANLVDLAEASDYFSRERVEEILKSEVETFSNYLNNDVYQYVVTEQRSVEIDGEAFTNSTVADSCGGFYSMVDVVFETECYEISSFTGESYLVDMYEAARYLRKVEREIAKIQ